MNATHTFRLLFDGFAKHVVEVKEWSSWLLNAVQYSNTDRNEPADIFCVTNNIAVLAFGVCSVVVLINRDTRYLHKLFCCWDVCCVSKLRLASGRYYYYLLYCVSYIPPLFLRSLVMIIPDHRSMGHCLFVSSSLSFGSRLIVMWSHSPVTYID